MNMGCCAECRKPLVSYEVMHGWISIQVGWRRRPARVHTVCRARFEARPFEEQQERAKAQGPVMVEVA